MAIYWPTPGFKGRIFKLCVLIRWDFNFCVRSSPLWGVMYTRAITMSIPSTQAMTHHSYQRKRLVRRPSRTTIIIMNICIVRKPWPTTTVLTKMPGPQAIRYHSGHNEPIRNARAKLVCRFANSRFRHLLLRQLSFRQSPNFAKYSKIPFPFRQLFCAHFSVTFTQFASQ